MPRDFVLPDLGEGLTEAEIVSWLVRPGDLVEIDQPVVEVESAKSTVELPSPYAGRVEALHAAEGDTVVKGGVLITVGEVVEALEGPGVMQGCVMGFPHCGPDHPCPMHGAWSQVKAHMGESMTKATIQDLQRLNTRSKPLVRRGEGETR